MTNPIPADQPVASVTLASLRALAFDAYMTGHMWQSASEYVPPVLHDRASAYADGVARLAAEKFATVAAPTFTPDADVGVTVHEAVDAAFSEARYHDLNARWVRAERAWQDAANAQSDRIARLESEKADVLNLSNRWVKAAVYATKCFDGALAFDPMNPEAFAAQRRTALDSLIERLGELQTAAGSAAAPLQTPTFNNTHGVALEAGIYYCDDCGLTEHAYSKQDADNRHARSSTNCPGVGRNRCLKPTAFLTTDKGDGMPLRDMQRINAQRSARWMQGSPGWTVLEAAGELAGEVGELANICKKLRRAEMGVPGNKLTDDELREQARGELGDVLVVLMLVASKLDVDLYEVTCDAFNAKSEQMGFPERFGNGRA